MIERGSAVDVGCHSHRAQRPETSVAHDRPPTQSAPAQPAATALPGADQRAKNRGTASYPDHQAPARSLGPALATIIVFGVWLGMTASLMLYVATYTRNVPYNDDWEL